jgi:hypothetical protein
MQIDPRDTHVRKGEGFDVAIALADVNDLGGVGLKLLFDKNTLRAETVTAGSLFVETGDIFFEQIDNEDGFVLINAVKWEQGNGTGTIGSISFTCLSSNPEGSLTLSEVRLLTYSTPTTDIEVSTITPGYVHPYPLEYFKLAATGTFKVGVSSSINIIAFDRYGTVAEGYNGTINLTVDNGTISPASVTGVKDGSLTAKITLTKSGTTTITAKDSAGTQTGTVTIYVIQGTPTTLFIQPATATLTADDSLTFYTFVGDNSGNTWTVTSNFSENDPIGTMSANIYYPGKPGTWTITANYNSLMATATVNVTLGLPIAFFIQPATATIATDGSLTFAAFIKDMNGNTQTVIATFTANEGTMSANTYYPGKPGTWTITATYTTFIAQATVVVYGKLATFTIGAIGNQIVGIAFPITISALTDQGEPAYTTASLTTTSGTILISVNGTYMGYVTIDKDGTASITVSSGTISATSNLFFVEKLFLPKSLDDIRVWPNPYRSDKSSDPFIVFELPKGCHLYIYTISGRLIREFENTLSRTKWMLDNQDGEYVSSGMYIYLIEHGGRKVTGDVGVIR